MAVWKLDHYLIHRIAFLYVQFVCVCSLLSLTVISFLCIIKSDIRSDWNWLPQSSLHTLSLWLQQHAHISSSLAVISLPSILAPILVEPQLTVGIKLKCNGKEMKQKRVSGSERSVTNKLKERKEKSEKKNQRSICLPRSHCVRAREKHFLFFCLSAFAVAIFFCLLLRHLSLFKPCRCPQILKIR